VILLAVSTLISIINQYYSWVMQGVDRVDFNGEVTFRTYVGSLVFHAHFAEFILTVVYVASIYPLIELSSAIRLPSPVITGVLLASILSTVVSLIYRFTHLRARHPLNIRARLIIIDVVAPAIAASVLTYVESALMLSAYPPVKGAVAELTRITAGAVLTSVTYLAAALTCSSNLRSLLITLIKYIAGAALRTTNSPRV